MSRRTRRLPFLFATLSALLAASACAGGAGDDDCPVGAVGCPCTSGGGCDAGLSCLSDLCVDASANGGEGGSGGIGGTGGTGGVGGTGGTGGTGVDLTLSAEVVSTCGTWEPDHQPGLSFMTPDDIRLGVASVALMRNHQDPSPHLIPLDPIVEIALAPAGDLLTLDTGALPEETFSHVRVDLAYSIYAVEAMGHVPADVPGTLELFMALSDHDAGGSSYDQGDFTATFSAFGQNFTSSGATPLNCMLSAWGGIATTTGGQFQVRVPIPGGPVTVSHAAATPLTIHLPFPMQDAFAWRDVDGSGFADDVLDIVPPPGTSEVVDSLPECNLLMADRCDGFGIAPVHPTWPMPDSSNDFCTDGSALVDPCPASGEAGFGQDATYAVNAATFTIDGDVVTDEVTGLVWQRATAPGTHDWWQARDYCAALALGGEEDWRLPSRIELVSLLDYSFINPTIDSTTFPGTLSDFYWTSSPVPFLSLAYGVRFELGFIYDHDPYGTGRVRCVRGAYAAPTPRFTALAETVTDNGTGLIWQRQASASAMTWLDALTTCEGLDLAGEQDWRLPTLKETQTLVDDRRLQPAIDVVAFPDTPSEWFWSSTPISTHPDQAWATSHTDGYASIHADSELHVVRCVR